VAPALASIFALVGSVGLAAVQAASPVVVIEGVAYAPQTVNVKRGDTVTWINKDPFPHTVTAPGAFDSREIAANASWKYTVRKVGRFDYICTLHPNMKATLVVE
jgi:plastocyanin